jgi:hypothetical protein
MLHPSALTALLILFYYRADVCTGEVQRLHPSALTALLILFYYRVDVCTGEDDDKQEVFQGEMINMDTSARSKVDFVSTVPCSKVT